MIADVTGHGFGPALLMASVRLSLRSLVSICSTPAEIVTRLNRTLRTEIEKGRFVTLLLVRLDSATRSLSYVNAGHPTGYVLDSCGDVKARLHSESLPLAILAEADSVTQGSLATSPGDIIVLLTDGVTEARSPRDDFFGEQRALELVRQNCHKSSRELVDMLCQAVLDFSECAAPSDDVTALVVKIES